MRLPEVSLSPAAREQASPATPSDDVGVSEPPRSERQRLPGLDISARNRLVGTVKTIAGEGVLTEVTLDLGGGNEIVSVITSASVERLGLHVGARAVALIKATEVMLAREAI